jgi:hypothetical protein
MHKFHQWRKSGDWEIYEGSYAIAVGESGKFDCFGKKDGDGTNNGKVRLTNDDLYFNPSSNVYVGQYNKNKAKYLVDKIDATLESDNVFRIATTNKLAPSQIITAQSRKKGVVIIYPKGNIAEKIHEESHVDAGMYKSKRSFHYNDEIKAIALQIAALKRRKLWNSRIRNKIISDLSTYSRQPYQKKRRAERSVKRIEAKLGLMR